MIYTVIYILEHRMDCVKCRGKAALIEQYHKLIQQGADVVVIKNVLGEEIYIELT